MEDVLTIKPLLPTQKESEKEREEIEDLHNFYRIKWKKDKDSGSETFDGIIFERVPFLERLKKMGFYVYHVGIDQKKYVMILDNVVKEVDQDYIINKFLQWIKILPTNEPANQSYSITSRYLEKKVIDRLEYLFKPILLRLLIPEKKILMQEDTKQDKYFFFKNGYITVTARAIEFKNYDHLPHRIWRDQILNRIYSPADDKESVFEIFCKRIAGFQDKSDPDYSPDYSPGTFEQRYNALLSIIGYNLHNYTRGKLRATILTDCSLGDDGEANGRTGKTLFCKALGHILNTSEKSSVYCEIGGRKFDVRDKHRYEKCNLDTKLVHLNDLYNHFNIEYLFNDISEGVEAKKMYESPFHIEPKMIISTNKTIKINGESAKDRVIQFEFSDFFNSGRSPADYYDHWFFDDWDVKEWNRFDKFIFSAQQYYLINGLIQPKEINLQRRSLIDHTDQDFIRWIEYCLSENDEEGKPVDPLERILINTKAQGTHFRYNKKELYNGFLDNYPDFKNKKFFDQKRFTRWIKFYMQNIYEVEISELRSSGNDFIIFTEIK